MCDRDLSPVITHHTTYIKEIFQQHLNAGKRTYHKLTDRRAYSILCVIKIRMGKVVSGKLCEIHLFQYVMVVLIVELI